MPSTRLKAAAFGTQLVRLQWIDNNDIENYFGIDRKSVYTDFVEIGKVEQNMTFFTDRGGNLYAGSTFSIAKKSLSTQILPTVIHIFIEFVFMMVIIIMKI